MTPYSMDCHGSKYSQDTKHSNQDQTRIKYFDD